MAATIPSLPVTDEVLQVADVYVDNYVMPKDAKGDALHLAYASYYKMDYLLTWNYKHLANPNKRVHLQIINSRLKLATPRLTTPLELLDMED
ncbi:MAG: hypothetical protein AAF639_02875 [Chloroflexota bacterium]